MELEILYQPRKTLDENQLDYYVNKLRKPLMCGQDLEIVEYDDGDWWLETPDNFSSEYYSGNVYLGELTEEQIEEYKEAYSEDDVVVVRFFHNGSSQRHSASMHVHTWANDWICPKCNTTNSVEDDKCCTHCGYKRETMSTTNESWNCIVCGNTDIKKDFCNKCGILKEYEEKVCKKKEETDNKISSLEKKIKYLENAALNSKNSSVNNITRRGSDESWWEREQAAALEDYRRQRARWENEGIPSEEYDFDDD